MLHDNSIIYRLLADDVWIVSLKCNAVSSGWLVRIMAVYIFIFTDCELWWWFQWINKVDMMRSKVFPPWKKYLGNIRIALSINVHCKIFGDEGGIRVNFLTTNQQINIHVLCTYQNHFIYRYAPLYCSKLFDTCLVNTTFYLGKKLAINSLS